MSLSDKIGAISKNQLAVSLPSPDACSCGFRFYLTKSEGMQGSDNLEIGWWCRKGCKNPRNTVQEGVPSMWWSLWILLGLQLWVNACEASSVLFDAIHSALRHEPAPSRKADHVRCTTITVHYKITHNILYWACFLQVHANTLSVWSSMAHFSKMRCLSFWFVMYLAISPSVFDLYFSSFEAPVFCKGQFACQRLKVFMLQQV